MKTKFKIERVCRSVMYVEAENEYEAEQIAEEADIRDFTLVSETHNIYEACND
jgi:hypothetical protein